jgi:hypothetical protein
VLAELREQRSTKTSDRVAAQAVVCAARDACASVARWNRFRVRHGAIHFDGVISQIRV